MSEIDLVPAEYRARLERRRWLVLLGLLAGVATAASAGAYGALAFATSRIDAEVAGIRMRNVMAEQQRAQLEELDEELADLRRRWRLLQGLRSGANAVSLFRIVDTALPERQVWFLDWRFRRAGLVDGDERQKRTVDTGYFVVVPAGRPANSQGDWQVETHMMISGQASDHEALSGFVRNLFEQPGVLDVRLHRTALRRYTATTVVDFELAVLLASDVEHG